MRVNEYNNLVVPFYSLKNHKMSGWQVIGSKGKWLRSGSSNKDVYLPIGGEVTDEVRFAEGISTGLSIHKIACRQVFVTFGKHNLDAVARFLLSKYPEKTVVGCLDHDKPDTMFIPKISDKRLVFLRPEAEGTDFNDCQDDPAEKNKLKGLVPVWTPPLPKLELPFQAQLLKQKLDQMGYELRLNTRKDRIEIKGFGSKQWAEMTDEGYSCLYLMVKGNKGKITKSSFEDQVKTIGYLKQVDPFRDYLEGLEWDGTKRLEDFLLKVFDVADPSHIPLAKWALKSILLGVVTRTFKPGAKHDEFIVFQGKQGIGKSLFLYHLFKDKSLFSSSLNFNEKTQKIVEGTLGKSLIEVAELTGVSKTALERLKNLITTQNDTVRLSYRKHARDYRRQFIFVGTTNSDKPLPDDLTGLRRFILVSLKGKLSDTAIEKLIKENRDQLWAEAVHCFKAGHSARLPKELWQQSAEVAEGKRSGDFSFEEEFLRAVDDRREVSIPAILKIMKDGETELVPHYGEDGQQFQRERRKQGTGGWIKDITPKYQQKAAELLKKAGYTESRERRQKGQRLRVWKRPPRAGDSKDGSLDNLKLENDIIEAVFNNQKNELPPKDWLLEKLIIDKFDGYGQDTIKQALEKLVDRDILSVRESQKGLEYRYNKDWKKTANRAKTAVKVTKTRQEDGGADDYNRPPDPPGPVPF